MRQISPDLHPDLHPNSSGSPSKSPPISIQISIDLHRCKLCDFGTALELSEGSPLPTACIGSALYLAPEVESERPYGLPADVFSFGVRQSAPKCM